MKVVPALAARPRLDTRFRRTGVGVRQEEDGGIAGRAKDPTLTAASSPPLPSLVTVHTQEKSRGRNCARWVLGGFSMEDFRSQSYGQMEVYRGRAGSPDGMGDFRCYNTSYASSYQAEPAIEVKFKRGKSVSSATSSSSKGRRGFKDPELQRKKRIAGYKMYATAGKMKISVTMVYGFR